MLKKRRPIKDNIIASKVFNLFYPNNFLFFYLIHLNVIYIAPCKKLMNRYSVYGCKFSACKTRKLVYLIHWIVKLHSRLMLIDGCGSDQNNYLLIDFCSSLRLYVSPISLNLRWVFASTYSVRQRSACSNAFLHWNWNNS